MIKALAFSLTAALVPILGASAQLAAASESATTESAWLARTWQTEEGLPANVVTGLAQTADGYIWLAARSGLMRFDGVRFEHFALRQRPEINDRIIRALYRDRRDRLWIVMNRGLLLCMSEAGLELFSQPRFSSRSSATCLAEDEVGNLWISTSDRLFRIHERTVVEVPQLEGITSQGDWWLANDTQGNLWCARGTQLGILRSGVWRSCWRFEDPVLQLAPGREGRVLACTTAQVFKCSEGGPPEPSGLVPNVSSLRVMMEDHEGAIWVGWRRLGLGRLKDKRWEPIPIPQADVTCLLEDREANLWVGTDGGGLHVLRRHGLKVISTQAGLPAEEVRSVCQDARGELWVALGNDRLARRNSGQWTTIDAVDGWQANDASCVAASSEGVWVGTRRAGLKLIRDGRIAREWPQLSAPEVGWVRSILPMRNGDLLVAISDPGQLWLYRDGTFRQLQLGVEARAIRALAEGLDGTAWAGTSDGSLLHVTGEHVVLERLSFGHSTPSIRTLHVTADGSLWIGFAGAGMGRYHDGRYTQITASQGLFDDYISQILSDDQERLWIYSNRGLFQVRLPELIALSEGRVARVRSVVYGRNEGLPGLQPIFASSPSVCRGAGGELWFCTRKGLVQVEPANLKDNPVPPPVILHRVLVDDEAVALESSRLPLRPATASALTDLRTADGPLRLPPGHKKLEFEFAALSYRSAENVHFRFRLSGFDREWVSAGGERRARYPALSPGRYTFEVTACNDSGVWNEQGRKLSLLVLPFFWQTWWFRLAVFAGFTSCLAAVVYYVSQRRLREEVSRLEAQAALFKERARIAKDIHDDLGGSLTQIGLLSELTSQDRTSPDQVGEHVGQIAGVTRQMLKSLDEIVWAVNPRHDTLPDLISYLGQYAMEFLRTAGIRCLADLPDHPPKRFVSAELRHSLFLAVKETLTNIVRHAGATEVRLQITVTDSQLRVTLADNGKGFDTDADNGLGDGLRNMRRRMEEVNGEYQLESKAGMGTKAVFTLPC